jgi:hypothetical protein
VHVEKDGEKANFKEAAGVRKIRREKKSRTRSAVSANEAMAQQWILSKRAVDTNIALKMD